MEGNVIVGQSGGPTAVINSSLAGVYKTAKDRGAKKVYGMLHGIKGLIDGKYVDLDEDEINSIFFEDTFDKVLLNEAIETLKPLHQKR